MGLTDRLSDAEAREAHTGRRRPTAVVPSCLSAGRLSTAEMGEVLPSIAASATTRMEH